VVLGLLAFLIVIGTAKATTDITSCQALATDGMEYRLTANITYSAGAQCFPINANNITINGNGNFLTTTVNPTGGVIYASGRINITVKNLYMNNTAGGPSSIKARIINTKHINIDSVNISTPSYSGIYLEGATQWGTINNSNISADYGIYFDPLTNANVSNITVTRTIFEDCGQGCIYIHDDNGGDFMLYNNITDNFFNGTVHVHIQSQSKLAANNTWNGSLYGNYWGKPDLTGFSDTCTDANGDGICDSGYALYADGKDYLPKNYTAFGTFSSPQAVTLTLVSPTNTTYYNNTVLINFTVTSGTLASIPTKYYLDGNLTVSGNVTNATYFAQYVNNGSAVHNLTVIAGFQTNTSSTVYFTTYAGYNNATLTASPSWSVNSGTAVNVSCSANLGSATLVIDNVTVTSPYSFTPSVGSHAVACSSTASGGYGSYTNSTTLTVGLASFDCFNTTTFIWRADYSVNNTVGNLTLDFGSLVSADYVNGDLHDVMLSNASNGSWRSGSKLIVNTTYAKQFSVYFGNYFANQSYAIGSASAYDYPVVNYSQVNAYLKLTLKSEETGAEGLPTTSNVSLVYGCDAGTTTINNVTNSTVYAPTSRSKFDYIMAIVTYTGGAQYFRQLLVQAASDSKDLYLADATVSTVLQIPIYMTDIAYYSSYVTVYKALGGGAVPITGGFFDVEHKFTAYAIKDNQYTIRVTKDSGVREIGFLYASVAAAQYISVQSISTAPTLRIISGHLRLWALWNNITGVLTARYEDDTSQTESVRIKVKEGLNQSALYDNTFNSSNNITVTINGLNTSKMYTVFYEVEHPEFGNSPVAWTLAAGTIGVLANVVPAGMTWLLGAMGFVIMTLVGMLAAPRFRLGVLVFMGLLTGVFVLIGWFSFAWPVIGAIIVIIALSVLYETKRSGN
jgi:hypothetical protein